MSKHYETAREIYASWGVDTEEEMCIRDRLVDTVTVLSEDRSHVRLYDGMSSNKN